MNLFDLTEIIIHNSALINFDNEIKNYDLSKRPEVAKWWREDKYYRMLTSLCQHLRCKHPAEIGTMYGGSAVAIAKGCGQVTTYDINLSNVVNQKLFDDLNVKTVLLEQPDDCTKIDFTQHDFLYIDIGNHEGIYERIIHNKLFEISWYGLVAYDDIKWGGMQNFWNEIKQEKISLDWHGDSGFGLVKYVN